MSTRSRNTRWSPRLAAATSLSLLFALPTTTHPDAVPTADAWVSPTTGGESPGPVLRPFDPPAHDWLPGHRGVDLELPRGRPVRAAGDGTVFFAGTVAGTATVSIDHPDGTRTTYQPVIAAVTAGDTVTEGQVIGRLGTDPRGWPGLSWGARRGGAYVNPLGLLPLPLIRLKPVDGPA
ncbi:murein hydrolase activator EnvC family protein [Corynebacterium sp. TAE3-ERU16]|uniref:murein hydrolase activator EnvC family protein n=1 Tax=Corynebacterium sp. TAE3-ERU16 TaxID=2849493 RepID=UPI001C4838C9|nr:M23 family metallopeptidase [Corynebacterium sp. TAE3-ERU16]MBV7294028.1 M23 family metallopeptidase [Corynebacterium sp. TAE3-ERU16]